LRQALLKRRKAEGKKSQRGKRKIRRKRENLHVGVGGFGEGKVIRRGRGGRMKNGVGLIGR
jgi:hypothetical protein